MALTPSVCREYKLFSRNVVNEIPSVSWGGGYITNNISIDIGVDPSTKRINVYFSNSGSKTTFPLWACSGNNVTVNLFRNNNSDALNGTIYVEVYDK